jgi:hypothetical protein
MEKETKIEKESSVLNWVLWWRVSPEELKKQVDGYATLKIHSSARGISFCLLLLSSVLTVIAIAVNIVGIYATIDAVLLLALGICILKGQRWAMVLAMILWSYEKLGQVFGVSTHVNIVTVLIWWVIYMHAFWLAYRVENERRKITIKI